MPKFCVCGPMTEYSMIPIGCGIFWNTIIILNNNAQPAINLVEDGRVSIE
jgi:hypothetical protein